jgi:hypothetical protein
MRMLPFQEIFYVFDILSGLKAKDSYGAKHKTSCAKSLRWVPEPTSQLQTKYLYRLTGHALPFFDSFS